MTFRRAYNTTFDTDSIPIGVDSCTSATVSGVRNLFIGKLIPVTGIKLRGVGGTLPIKARGTLQMTFVDDRGKTHHHRIENAYYAPKLQLTLLSPRQWSLQGQLRRDGSRIREWTVDGDKTMMRFEFGTKTVPYDPKTNLPILTTKPGFSTFEACLNTMHLTSMEARLRPSSLSIQDAIFPQGIQVDNQNTPLQPADNRATQDPFRLKQPLPNAENQLNSIELEDFNFDSILLGDNTTKTLRDLNETDKKTLMLRWHYRLGHMPFKDLRAMAEAGRLDPRLKTIQEFPFCPGCQFGKASRRAWRHRSKKKDGS